MNILFYMHKYPSYGGIENVTTYLANYFVSKGHGVQIYSFVGVDFELLLSKLDNKVKFTQAHDSDDYCSQKNYEQLKQIVRGKKIDFIIFQDSYAPVDKLLWKLKRDIPTLKIITVEHNTPNAFLKALRYEIPLSRMERIKRKFFYPYFYFKISLLIKRRHCRIYHESDKYVLLTSKFSSVFAQISGISKAEKLIAINNPITIEMPSSVDWDKKQKICLFPARLVSQKGIDYLMSVWAKIEKVKTDWELVIVGDGPERSKIDKFIEVKNLQHVRLEGFKSDMKPYYGEASILIATSIYEGWPLTLSESMAYGCIPVIFNSYLAASEIVDDGNTGFLVPPFDVDVFAQKLLFLMDNSSKRMFMAQTAVDTSGKYKIENVGEKWLTLFNCLK